MNSKYESSTCIADNLYAFLGWVVSYSDYGKEVTVDAMLKRFKLLDKIDDSKIFENKEEYDEYNTLTEKFIKLMESHELGKELSEYERKRCEELEKEFTSRYKRAKQFTMTQIGEYKARKCMNKEGSVILEEMNPVKIIDHEREKVVCVFYSPESASRALSANKKKIKDAAEKNIFYKGYIWMYCDEKTYEEYEKEIVK